MNAKRTQTTCALAGAALLLACFVSQADGAPAAGLMPSAAPPRQVSTSETEYLSRSDVDNLLRQAQQAIQDGNFDQAEVLIDRAQRAQIHYPLFHFGPTPSSVRRQLTHAQRAQTAAAKPPAQDTNDDRYAVSAASHEEPEPTNPFARPQPLLPSALASQPAPPTPAGRDTAAISPTLPPKQMPAPPDAEPLTDRAWTLADGPLPPGIGQRDLSRHPSTPVSSAAGKAQALQQLRQARQALDAGNLDLAENLARAASALGVPESQFLPNDDRPSLLAWDVMQARAGQASGLSAAAHGAAGNPRHDGPAPLLDINPYATPDDALLLLQQGEEALQQQNRQAALERFRDAYLLRERLDPASRQRLQAHLQMLSSDSARDVGSPRVASATPSLIETADTEQQVLARQLSAEVGKCQSEARRLREEDSQRALTLLKDMRGQVEDSKLPEEYRSHLLRRLDITANETEKYIDDHRAEIELDTRNQAVLEEVDRNREVKVKVQQQVADLVDQFNRLRDEQRYAEMEIVARRLIELAPDDDVAKQVWQTAKFIRREMMNRELADRREESYWSTLNDVENSAVQEVGDGREMIYDQKHWDALVKNRKGISDRNNRRTERELEIERRLKTPVLLRYEDTPLSQVAEGLSQLAGVNIHLDPRGLSQEGVHSDTPVTVNLNREISLKSALNLILEPLHLSYVIKDEVLKITSEQLRDGELVTVTYNVADLVIPIPNFVPSNNIGLQGLINDAHAAMGYGQGIGVPGPTVLLSDRGPRGGAAAGNGQVLAQQLGGSLGGAGGTLSPASMPSGSGPGGLGGGANADFDSLIDLIVSTVATETWAENGGGEAEVRPFPTNLSLVISQTQAVHEEIADLLEQLRRLQDLQVSIEVRFITLSDRFFERIGIDFDMNIQDRTTLDATTLNTVGYEEGQQSAVVGATASTLGLPAFTADLDVPFRQGSFNATSLTPFVSPTGAATFGYAILSDIEAYFLIEAAQGDSRTNVLQAPKVTLFNGQQAFVGNFVSQPFVMGVIPVVGEFAAAQQPIIVVLNEGTLMTIQAVVSDDRRYVRLTVVPFFTEIGEVQEFTFEGSSSSTSASSSSSSSSTSEDQEDETDEDSDSEEVLRSGVTVQLPTFTVQSVLTTVSVPDGGTVLLGGIKTLSEGRTEIGVPLLSKVPYVNRLFRNVGIGRETSSLMMMVTPRIIIQEEEEERLGISAP